MTYNQLTTEQFVERAKAIHGDKYDYSNTIYLSMCKKVNIRCYKHGTFEQLAGNHINPKIKAGCPYCASKKVYKGETDLQSQYPNIAVYFDEEKNDIKSDEVFAHSPKKYWWKCDNGHSFSMSILNRTHREISCPYCSGQKLLTGFNDLQTIHPDIAKEWDYDKNIGTPSDYRYGSGYKAWWVCKDCGESYQSPINIHIRGHKCPYCAGLKIKSGRNDFKTLFPDIAKEFSSNNDISADKISPMTHKKYLFLCPICGKEYKASPQHRILNGTACPFCHQSSGEQTIRKILDKYGVTYKAQEWFDDLRDKNPLKFDFTLYDENRWVGAIEYNGKQHYDAVAHWGGEEAKKVLCDHDTMKIKYCLEHLIPLLIIPYRDYSGSTEELTIRFLHNLGLVKGQQL